MTIGDRGAEDLKDLISDIDEKDKPKIKSDLKDETITENTKTEKQERTDRTGLLSEPVGTGKHARTNIIWYIISATFVIFAAISSALMIMTIYGVEIKTLSDSIKEMWGMFTPIITLALGYLFGRQGNSKKEKQIKNKE